MADAIRPVIVAHRTTNISPETMAIFAKLQPFGLLVFNENCQEGKKGLKRVVQQFREAVGRPDAPVLIDNEGGKVWRMKPQYDPEWFHVPSAEDMAKLAQKDLQKAKNAVRLSAQITAAQMLECGVTVNCAPVVDVLTDDTFDEGSVPKDAGMHSTSADMVSRAYGENVKQVVTLTKIYAEELMRFGVTPIIKHIPGLGRMKADPHYVDCLIEHSFEKLAAQDFEAFRQLNHIPAAMTSHGVYTAIDPDHSATLSSKVITDVIRGHIGFKGVLIADTLEMNAIWPEGFDQENKDRFGMGLPKKGTMAKLTKKAFAAGCDVILHSDCSGDFDYVLEILEASPVLTVEEYQHLRKMLLVKSKETLATFDLNAAQKDLIALLSV